MPNRCYSSRKLQKVFSRSPVSPSNLRRKKGLCRLGLLEWQKLHRPGACVLSLSFVVTLIFVAWASVLRSSRFTAASEHRNVTEVVLWTLMLEATRCELEDGRAIAGGVARDHLPSALHLSADIFGFYCVILKANQATKLATSDSRNSGWEGFVEREVRLYDCMPLGAAQRRSGAAVCPPPALEEVSGAIWRPAQAPRRRCGSLWGCSGPGVTLGGTLGTRVTLPQRRAGLFAALTAPAASGHHELGGSARPLEKRTIRGKGAWE